MQLGKRLFLRSLADLATMALPGGLPVPTGSRPATPAEHVERFRQAITYSATPAEQAERFRRSISDALRSDPDIVMIGRIRDPEAANLAMEGARRGRTVWRSLPHDPAVVERLEDILRASRSAPAFPSGESAALRRLFRRAATWMTGVPRGGAFALRLEPGAQGAMPALASDIPLSGQDPSFRARGGGRPGVHYPTASRIGDTHRSPSCAGG